MSLERDRGAGGDNADWIMDVWIWLLAMGVLIVFNYI